MKILVTGKNGFLAKNVIDYFSKKHEIFSVSHNDPENILREYCSKCDYIFHLAAVQRAELDSEFWDGNVIYTKKIIEYLENENNIVPILFTTSTLIDKKSIFSDSKIEAENLIRAYSINNFKRVYIFKLNHIFGKYGKPNFNSVISTFCYNVANKKPLIINNPSTKIDFTYIDDLLYDFEKCVKIEDDYNLDKNIYYTSSIKYSKTLGELVMILGNICNNIFSEDEFEKKLYETLSFYLKRE